MDKRFATGLAASKWQKRELNQGFLGPNPELLAHPVHSELLCAFQKLEKAEALYSPLCSIPVPCWPMQAKCTGHLLYARPAPPEPRPSPVTIF